MLFIFCCCGLPGYKEIRKLHNGYKEIIYYPDFRKPGNCFIKTFYPNGRLFQVAVMSDGKYVGLKAMYLPNGYICQTDRILTPCDTTKTMCDELLTRYNKNGTPSRRYLIKNGLINGLNLYYDTTGKLLFECDLKDGRIKDGNYTVYRPNGILAYKGTYKNDTLVGYQYFFDEFGDSLKYYNTYKGQMDFPYKKWLSLELMLCGDYTDKKGKSVTWRWVDYTGKEIKRKIAFPIKGSFACPE
jgi:antitoxin component YwqK of YwqJK toxin-antitoxin module